MLSWSCKGVIGMNWSTDKSIILSRVCVAVFALLLAALDVGAYWIVGWYIRLRGMAWQNGVGMILTVYLCSIFGWILLLQMRSLLRNISRGEVFVAENVRCLRIVSWCCAAAGAICLVSTLCYVPFVIVAAAAGFMALIVRIVKNVFQQAIRMKDELDYTI